MKERKDSPRRLHRDYPAFFWGTLALVLVLIGATIVVGLRIPGYQRQAEALNRRLNADEREVRDQVLNYRARRTELALALLQREMRLKALQEKAIHLAISTDDSTLMLRHGPATLRQIRVHVGPDSVIRAPDGRTWRFVRALGERHVQAKEAGAEHVIPEWVYVSRGQPVPDESERTIKNGLGRYILRLDDGTEIYSRPDEGPFAQGVKPAAFVVDSERDMRAIFDALSADMPVYIY